MEEKKLEEKKTIIKLSNIRKSYDGKINVLENISLDIKEGEFVTLLGPSGCGKTTLLRMIGGFDMPTEGEILLDGSNISVLPPYQRPINTVFQKYALFPHLNVYDNVAFGLKMKKVGKAETEKKVKEALEIVDLEGFENRSIQTLSGGQQQRIAIARAIVNRPRVLLLDEPLSALDYKMRKEMQIELKQMHKTLGITFIFVTHDQEEALTMSDKVVVMADGAIQQVGTPEDIYNEPANVFVADFIGESNIFNGRMVDKLKVSFAGSMFECVDDLEKGIKIDAVVRPEDVDIVKEGEGQLSGEVTSCDFKGTFYVMFVQCGQYEMEVHCFDYYEPGSIISLSIDPDMIHIIPYDTSINHYEGFIESIDSNKNVNIKFADTVKQVALDSIFEGASYHSGSIKKSNGETVDITNVKLDVSYEPSDARMTDDAKSGDVEGTIFSFHYIGDHYEYIVRSSTEEDYYVDDDYLWNQGDRVGVIIPSENLVIKVVE